MGGVAFKNVSAAVAAGSGNITITPGATVTGDLMLCVVTSRDNVALTFPAGWEIVFEGNNSTSLRGTCAVKTATGVEGAFTVTHTGGSGIIGAVVTYSGAPGGLSAVVASGLTANGSVVTVTANPLSDIIPGDMVVFILYSNSNTTWSGAVGGSPPVLAERLDANQGGGTGDRVMIGLADGIKTLGNTGTVTGTLSFGPGANSGGLLLLRPTPVFLVGNQRLSNAVSQFLTNS